MNDRKIIKGRVLSFSENPFNHNFNFGSLSIDSKCIYVKNGQKVKQGDVIGTVGSTGRSTGPHLDIRLNWFDVRLDPATVLKLN